MMLGTETLNWIIRLKITERERQTLQNSYKLGKKQGKSGYFKAKGSSKRVSPWRMEEKWKRNKARKGTYSGGSR